MRSVVCMLFLHFLSKNLGHIQAHTGAQCFATVSGLNDMFPGNSVQQSLRNVFYTFIVFSRLVGVSEMSAQSAATCI